MARWIDPARGSMAGRSVVITGSGGLGYETARALANAGARVTLASRNPEKGRSAVEQLRAAIPNAQVSFEVLDLANLASISAFAQRMLAERTSLDVLINNAGVMAPPKRLETTDGFEVQFATNYLGAFALTAQLLPLIRAGKAPRLITVSSLSDRSGTINFDDLQSKKSYNAMAAYEQSKRADLVFALEFKRRSDAAQWGIASIVAHPGIARTDIIPNGAGRNSPIGKIMRIIGPIIAQTPAAGARSIVFAASSPDAKDGAYYGPTGPGSTRGNPGPALIAPSALDAKTAARLWSTSEQLSGAHFQAA